MPDAIRVATTDEVREGRLFAARVEGVRLLVSRVNGTVHAVVDRCPHMGMSMAKGSMEDGVITCPWHNSKFDFCTGRNLAWVSAIMGVPMPGWTHKTIALGKPSSPLQTLRCEERDGEIFVSL
ncbi:MAG: Rieske 2Fe-2S domain-containing protein [Gammaproteobacteria bacterium]|nr:MAG: Rieske 2Fe-2S domain-containing protein [Gammaproteobacteria bacterium]